MLHMLRITNNFGFAYFPVSNSTHSIAESLLRRNFNFVLRTWRGVLVENLGHWITCGSNNNFPSMASVHMWKVCFCERQRFMP